MVFTRFGSMPLARTFVCEHGIEDRTIASHKRRPQNGPANLPALRAPPVQDLHPTTTPPEISSFREWDLDDAVLDAITDDMKIVSPTPIQALSVGEVLAGRDVIAKAETGTGKTLAFGAPIVSMVDPGRVAILALILCPDA